MQSLNDLQWHRNLPSGSTCREIQLLERRFVAAAAIRSEKELKALRQTCKLARDILDTAHAAVKPGITTDEIDRVVSVAGSLALVIGKGCCSLSGCFKRQYSAGNRQLHASKGMLAAGPFALTLKRQGSKRASASPRPGLLVWADRTAAVAGDLSNVLGQGMLSNNL